MVEKQFQIEGIDYSNTVYGLSCGRFQPLHYGHFEFIDRSLDYVDTLIIGIANPDINAIKQTGNAKNREKKESNIFDFAERRKMLADLFARYFIGREHMIVPFDLNSPNAEIQRLPNNLLLLHTVYDSWGTEKSDILKQTRIKQKLLWTRTKKITTGSIVRSALQNQSSWEHIVPPTSRNIILNIGLDEISNRLRNCK